MIEILIALIVIGAILYIIRLAPLDNTIKQVIYVVIVVVVLVYLLRHLPAFV